MTNTAPASITDLRNALAAATVALDNAGRAYSLAEAAMQADGCSAESVKAARKARYSLSAAKGAVTSLENKIWFAARA
jgi:hypothetical protein